MSKWWIESLQIAGNFLDGLSLTFSPRLVCIIGPRGSGKSTLAEAVRLALRGSNGIARPRTEMVRENLGAAAITLRTSGESESSRYVLRRVLGQPPTLYSGDGRHIEAVDLDRGTFLPIDAYGTGDIEELAKAELGPRRRELLDDLRSAEMHQIRQRVADFRRSLEANADAIRAADRQLSDITEQIEELGDARERLTAQKSALGEKHEDDMLAATRRSRSDHDEAAEMIALQGRLERISAAFGGLAGEVRRDCQLAIAANVSANEVLLAPIRTEAASLAQSLEAQLQEAARTITAGNARIAERARRLEESHRNFAVEFQEMQARSQAATAAAQQRAQAEQAVARLERLERSRAEFRLRREQLLDERRKLRAKFLLEGDRISTLRAEEATRLSTEIGGNVRISVRRNADSQRYEGLLLQGLRGARVRNHEDILHALMRLRPEQLAQIVQDNDAEELESLTSLGSERCRKILDSFRGSLDPLELEVETLEDRISVELNVATGAEPLFKDASNVSRGQQCTAILPLLLARRNTPLLIDQPEDNLDNRFVFETVVESIRRMKPRRQMIFVTHNANIPVLGEAELVVVLNSDGRRGFVEKAGTLDECRDEIVDLLEGGREAFELRRQRYGAR